MSVRLTKLGKHFVSLVALGLVLSARIGYAELEQIAGRPIRNQSMEALDSLLSSFTQKCASLKAGSPEEKACTGEIRGYLSAALKTLPIRLIQHRVDREFAHLSASDALSLLGAQEKNTVDATDRCNAAQSAASMLAIRAMTIRYKLTNDVCFAALEAHVRYKSLMAKLPEYQFQTGGSFIVLSSAASNRQ